MKKIQKAALGLITLAVALGASACGGAEPEQTTGTDETTQTPVTTAATTADTYYYNEPVYSTVVFTQAKQTEATTSAVTDATSGTQGSGSDASSDTSATEPTTEPVQQTDSYPIADGLRLSVPPPAVDTLGYSESELYSFFDDAVFVGDSISLGWRNYCMTKRAADSNFLGKAQFLVSGSLGAESALWDITADSVHPTYEGSQMQLWNSIPLTGAKKVFIMFGLNDVGRYSDLDYGISMAVSNYTELISRIKANVPDAKFYIISATYVLEGGEKGKVTSENLRKLNTALIKFCNEQGHTFINFADALADANGNLAAEYCSDGYVHQSNAAYDVWTKLLLGYAAAHR